MGDRSISKVSASWLNNSLCWIIVFVVSLLSLPLEVMDGDNDDLDGDLLRESEDGRSVKVPQLFCHWCHSTLKP